jgi:hypothetical protein
LRHQALPACDGGEHREQHACSDTGDRACRDLGNQAGHQRHQRHRGEQGSKRQKQAVLQQGGQGEEVHTHDRADPDRNEVALPGAGQDGRADPGQGEFHADDEAVSTPGSSVVQGAG